MPNSGDAGSDAGDENVGPLNSRTLIGSPSNEQGYNHIISPIYRVCNHIRNAQSYQRRSDLGSEEHQSSDRSPSSLPLRPAQHGGFIYRLSAASARKIYLRLPGTLNLSFSQPPNSHTQASPPECHFLRRRPHAHAHGRDARLRA
ncbi:hypothetical protein D9619_013422 [Psilocybe cf. subviscida]|uniref:Uncharacterized protein n=1 Tax=Psilocybe cf. subviscida TaxID=2480587 RepID=A0A8H5BSF9_9AGAR|nr:hypothetical protein D9619_013422 [Psilocybe cf. subviscida]